jgi:hypothetical protein
MVVGDNEIDDNKKYTSNAGHFDDHADAAVQHRSHCLIENIQGFTESHWMPPSGECLRRIALAAAMVDVFVETTLNIKENTPFSASKFDTF